MNRDRVEGSLKRFKDGVKTQRGKVAGVAGMTSEAPTKASVKTVCLLKEDVPPRRLVLRGALAVGWGLLLPAALTGCDSKKGESPTGAAPAGPASPPAPSADSAAPAVAKVSKASVQYQTQPKGEQKCGDCMYFIAESSTCQRVEGQISPEGWCILWTKKT